MDFGVGDILEVAKLAWDLYDQCYKVARAAPSEFRQLVSELGALHAVLKNVRDDVNSEKSYVKRLDTDRKESLKRLLKGCFDSLRKIHDLVEYFRQLGSDENGLQVWKRIQWVKKKGEVAHMKNQVTAQTTKLQLCMTDINNASLARIEYTIEEALVKQEEANQQDAAVEEDDLSPLIKPQTSSIRQDSDLLDRRPKRIFTGGTLVDVDTPPSTSGDSDSGSPFVTKPARHLSSPTSKTRRYSSRTGEVYTSSSPFIDSSPTQNPRKASDAASGKGLMGDNINKGLSIDLKAKSINPSIPSIHEASLLDLDLDFRNAIDIAKEELAKSRQRERQAKPLKIPDKSFFPEPSEELRRQFDISLNTELEYRQFNTRDWLRIGTWWLLKAMFRLDAMKSSGIPMRQARQQLNYVQAYVDLVKASWILFDRILTSDYDVPMHSDENRKLFMDLGHGIREEHKLFRSQVPDLETFDDPDLNFELWEHIQALEEGFEQEFSEVDHSRWITVEEGDAGHLDEKVLFRTFIDAAIGGRGSRVHSKGASYMLLLFTAEGQSEPKVALVNQNGTMGLSRDFTIDDLEEFGITAEPRITGNRSTEVEAVPLNFGDLETRIRFINDADSKGFLDIPRVYFKTVQRREPQEIPNQTETLIFESSLDEATECNTSTMKPLNRKSKALSCNLRILETTCHEGWRTTRRLVLSSSAAERMPWCREFFLPMDRVQLSDGLVREVNIKWSDCSQQDFSKTDGQYHTIYSYVYDDTKPNHAFNLFFRFDVDAERFKKAILSLPLSPAFTWSNGPDQYGAIYEVADTDPKPKKYRAICLTFRKLDWTYSQLFYTFRDTDYKDYNEVFQSVKFPQLSYTDYLSSHAGELWQPKTGPVPGFKKCVKKVNQHTFQFPSIAELRAFMTALSTEGNELVFSGRASYIATDTSFFRSSKSKSKGRAEVLLWKRRNEMRFLSRWGDLVDDKWISMRIDRKDFQYASTENKVTFDRAVYQKGTLLDIANLEAVRPKEKERGTKQGSLIVHFESSREREEFVAVVEGKARGKRTATGMVFDGFWE